MAPVESISFLGMSVRHLLDTIGRAGLGGPGGGGVVPLQVRSVLRFQGSIICFLFYRLFFEKLDLKKIEKRRVTFISNRWLREPPFESRFWRSFDVTALPEGGVFPSPQTALLRAT